jgi:hypothetical protein
MHTYSKALGRFLKSYCDGISPDRQEYDPWLLLKTTWDDGVFHQNQ